MSSEREMFDDSTLIRMTLSGRTEYFDMLMERHGSAVRARIRAIVPNSFEADDLYQEAWFKAWRNLSSFQFKSSFRTWVVTIATNECLMMFRRQDRRKRSGSEDELVQVPSHEEGADQAMVRSEQRDAVYRAMVKLPVRYQQVVALRDIHELTIQETAEKLRSTQAAVKTQLFRGRLMLVKAMKDTEDSSLLAQTA
ncbi:MAG: RNA polymerase sigma factor [Acidobacteriaceae bacterium]|nr:RNA polymerase sigma factor [Acidobacteriaceae bacterium]